MVKNLPTAGKLGSIPELGRSPGEGNGYPLQYSGLENSMNCMVHGVHGVHEVPESQTLLRKFHCLKYAKNIMKAKRREALN